MDPQFNEVIWLFDRFLFGSQNTLEYICQVSAVELVMEVLSSLLEISVDIRVERKSCLDDWLDLRLNSSLEFGEMSGKIGLINLRKRILIWHADGKEPEVSL